MTTAEKSDEGARRTTGKREARRAYIESHCPDTVLVCGTIPGKARGKDRVPGNAVPER